MLINDFFQVIASEESPEGITTTIGLNKDHRIYGGHFPGNPVTPGVVELQIVKELLEQKYGRPLQMHTMPRCKYLSILNPSEFPEVEIKITFSAASTPELISISASGEKGGQVFFKFNATYR